jgi:hypothetical protein
MLKTNNDRVLSKLKRNKNKGITHWDFPSGFALRSRIAELRSRGYQILTNLEKNADNKGRHARYFLMKEI